MASFKMNIYYQLLSRHERMGWKDFNPNDLYSYCVRNPLNFDFSITDISNKTLFCWALNNKPLNNSRRPHEDDDENKSIKRCDGCECIWCHLYFVFLYLLLVLWRKKLSWVHWEQTLLDHRSWTDVRWHYTAETHGWCPSFYMCSDKHSSGVLQELSLVFM